MILFFRAFFILIIISFLILVGTEARPLLGNDDGMLELEEGIENYARKPYVTPKSTKQEIVGRHDHHLLPPPSPKHDPVIGQLTTTILVPIRVVGRHDQIPAPPAPKPEDKQGQIIITSSSTNNQHYLPLQASY